MNLINAINRMRPLLAKADRNPHRTYINFRFDDRDVAALRAVIGEAERRLQYDDEEVEQRNIGAVIMAKKFLEIANTGDNAGHFGDKTIQAAADAIAELRRANADLEDRIGVLRKRYDDLQANPVPQHETVKTDTFLFPPRPYEPWMDY
jgi:hypothetical protein